MIKKYIEMKTVKKVILSLLAGMAFIAVPMQSEAQVERNMNEPECQKLYGEDSLKARQMVSLYRDEFNRGTYMNALPFWRYVFENAPCLRDYITTDGVYLMTQLIAQTDPKDTATIKGYADTMVRAINTYLRLFGDNYDLIGQKGGALFKYYPDRRKEAIELLIKAMEHEQDRTFPTILTNLILAITQENRANPKELNDERVLEIFDQVSVIIGNNIKKYKNDITTAPPADTARLGQSLRYWQWADEYTIAVVNPYLTCEKLTEIYSPKFKATPDDKELVEKIVILLKRAPNCAKTEFYLTVAEKNLGLNPNADAAAALANAYQEKGQTAKAKNFYEKAADLEADKDKKVQYYVVLGQLELNGGSCTQARNYARKALDINPNSGDAYIIIGNAYMQCAGGCGETNVQKAFPYLAAYDKFLKAKTVDPSVAATASKYMASAQARWPKKEDAFFDNLTEGTQVTVGCWIGETTILRVTQ